MSSESLQHSRSAHPARHRCYRVCRVLFSIGAFLLAIACPAQPAPAATVDREIVFGLQMRTDAADPGSLGAYARELADTIARATGLRYKIVEYDLWPELRAAFERGEIDVMPLVTRLTDREANMSFTVPHFRASYMVFARAGTPRPKKIEDIGAGRIVVQENSATHQYLRRQPWGTRLIVRPDVRLAMADLVEGRADYWVNNSLIGAFRMRESGYVGKIVPVLAAPGEANEVCMAVRAFDHELLALLNDGLFTAGQNGDLRRIYEKWNPLFESHWLPRETIRRWAIALAILVSLGTFVYLWRLRRARQRTALVEGIVQERTRELAAANEQLRRSEAHFRLVWENSLDGMRLTDETGTVRRVNAAFCRLMELPREQLEGHSLATPYAPERRAAILGKFHERFRTHDIQELQEATITLASGRVLHLEASNVFLDLPGEPPLLLSVFRDVSARHRVEKERALLQSRLFQSQKQEALGVLAGGVAHDFNNILTAVINYSMLAQSSCPAGHEDIHGYLHEVITAGHRAAELVRQILLYTRAQDATRKPLDLAIVVREALSLLRASLSATIELEPDFDASTPAILGNASQLHQVLMNLGINAAQAIGPRPGRISVLLRPCTVDLDLARKLPDLRPGEHVCLQVSDSGCGMDPVVLARIFEPFFTTKPVGQGTGLGLAVVHGIVRSHHGAITVHSRPGTGTTFTLYIPAYTAPAAPPPAPAAPAATTPLGRNHHILLVDDEPSIALSLRLTLESYGFRVTACTDPADALARLEAAPDKFALFLTDYNMPGMDGITLAGRVHAIRPGLPILLSTGFAGGFTAETLRSLGIATLIDKPFQTDLLTAALARHLPQGTGTLLTGT